MEALALANEIRGKRTAMKRDLRAGELDVVEVLRDPPHFARNMTMGELLRAVRGIGPDRCRRLLLHARVSELRALSMLTRREAECIVAVLNERPSVRAPTERTT